MNHFKVKFIIAICCVFLFAQKGMAGAIPLPNDLPTIEALISLHKLIKHDEDRAMERVAASFGEQSLVTKGVGKFNDVRTTLNTKLSNGYSYILLASSLSTTANSLYKLIDEYSKFTGLAFKYVTKKPAVAWYYTEANYACAREIKNIKGLYLSLTASGMNIMKASMDEKMDILFSLKASIDNMRRIIDSAWTWCSIITEGDFRYDYIWDILNSDVTGEIAKDVINKWNQV
jgi:hypothetical protein